MLIRSCHEVILYNFPAWKWDTQVYNWVHSCLVFQLSGYAVSLWSVNSILWIGWNQCNCISFCASAYHEVVTTLYVLIHPDINTTCVSCIHDYFIHGSHVILIIIQLFYNIWVSLLILFHYNHFAKAWGGGPSEI